MPWLLLMLTYAAPDTAIPPDVTPFQVSFASEALCEDARAKIEASLPTRDVKVRTVCVQATE